MSCTDHPSTSEAGSVRKCAEDKSNTERCCRPVASAFGGFTESLPRLIDITEHSEFPDGPPAFEQCGLIYVQSPCFPHAFNRLTNQDRAPAGQSSVHSEPRLTLFPALFLAGVLHSIRPPVSRVWSGLQPSSFPVLSSYS